jgi:uncharacterized membrane protein YfcA
MESTWLVFPLVGVAVGVGASFTGLGGGFLVVPLLLAMGWEAQKSVGTSFVSILVVSVSALVAHGKLAHVDYRVGLLLGAGGVVGAQLGPRLLAHVPAESFRKLFAGLLVGLAAYVFFKR